MNRTDAYPSDLYEWREVNDNGFHCDFCDQRSAGFVRVGLVDRSLSGMRAVHHFQVCPTHMSLGDPVYPERRFAVTYRQVCVTHDPNLVLGETGGCAVPGDEHDYRWVYLEVR